ncbi:hypothetical protein Tco_1559336, partial [Tanacetum coccineum]
IHHWRDNHQWFYKGGIGRLSAYDVYLKIKIISVQRRKADKMLNLNDIEDLYLLKIQDKIHSIDGVDEFDLINALLLYIRRIMIKKRVKDAQLGVPYSTMSHPKGVMYLDNRLGYGNEGMKDRKWTRKGKERTKLMLEKIKKMLKERRRMRRLEHFVGGRRREIDYTLLVRLE